jgi:hypothetical protein
VRSRLAAEPKLANRRYKPPDADALPLALQVVAAAKEVSHPDSYAATMRGVDSPQPCWKTSLTRWRFRRVKPDCAGAPALAVQLRARDQQRG